MKPLSEFNKDKNSRDGLRGQCRACQKVYRKAWGESNKERTAAYDAAYYAANKERRAARKADWQRANPDKVKASMQRRRARKRNAQGTFTADQWKARLDYHGYKCIYCGVEKHQTPEGWLTCDHQIPLARGGSNWPSNLVPACKSCNSSKRDRTYFEFIEYLERKKNQ